MIQRPAALSYTTVASPSLLVWQPPPKPAQSELVGTGPWITAFVALSNTAIPVLTTCTYCVAPTAPTVSGGAYWTVKAPCGPLNPLPTPSTAPLEIGANAWNPGEPCNAPSD